MREIVRPLAPRDAEGALRDLLGIAALLLDAAQARDPSQRGVEAAARVLEEIHDRLVMAVGFQEGPL